VAVVAALLPTDVRAAVQTILFSSLVLLIVGSASSVVVRFLRSTGDARQQLKWFAFATVVVALSFPFTFLGAGPWFGVVLNVMSYGVPVAIGIAVLRYRLYDIDVVIERTLVYGTTTAAIGAAFFGGIVVLQTILRPLTSGSELAVAISTLVSVALFQPLRGRVQDAVDRRFYRSRYDAARTLDDFSVRLRDQVALDSVRADLLDAVRDTVQPTHASVWLRERT
jgi:hypothetical protein